MLIITHSSKTMRTAKSDQELTNPAYRNKANEIALQVAGISVANIMKLMKVSEKLAIETKQKYAMWDSQIESPAIFSFIGDIYSGMQAHTFNNDDLAYAQQNVRILSGLYGVLKPLDKIKLYRYEMGYKYPDLSMTMYTFWGNKIAKALPNTDIIINASSQEYMKPVFDNVKTKIITPKFLTIHPRTKKPTFVAVHSKIARGALVYWCTANKIKNVDEIKNFNAIGYSYAKKESTHEQPVFICKDFKGLGLSQRLAKN